MSQQAAKEDSAEPQGLRPAPHRAYPRLGRGPAPHRSLGASTAKGGAAPEPWLHLRCQVRLVGGQAGRALAAGQGRALADLRACLAPIEVGRGEEDAP